MKRRKQAERSQRGIEFTLCISKSNVSTVFASVVAKLCLWRGIVSFVSCLREKTVITKKGYQPLKDTGKTEDMSASYSSFTLETRTDLSWKTKV